MVSRNSSAGMPLSTWMFLKTSSDIRTFGSGFCCADTDTFIVWLKSAQANTAAMHPIACLPPPLIPPPLPALASGHVLQVLLVTGRIFEQPRLRIRIQPAPHRKHLPRLLQDLRIVHGRLPNQEVALATDPFDDPHVVRMEKSRPAKPAFVGKAHTLDHERVAFPPSGWFAVPVDALRPIGVMWPPVGGNHSKAIVPFV